MDRGDLKDIDGFFAVLLWDEYIKTKNQQTLDTLLALKIRDSRFRLTPTLAGLISQIRIGIFILGKLPPERSLERLLR